MPLTIAAFSAILCSCCFLLFLGLIVIAVLVSVLGHDRKRRGQKMARTEGECDDKGPVVDAEFKDVTKEGT